MSSIEKGRNILTLINVFTVAPEKQQELVTLLIAATQQTMKHLPGFIFGQYPSQPKRKESRELRPVGEHG